MTKNKVAESSLNEKTPSSSFFRCLEKKGRLQGRKFSSDCIRGAILMTVATLFFAFLSILAVGSYLNFPHTREWGGLAFSGAAYLGVSFFLVAGLSFYVDGLNQRSTSTSS